MPACSATAGPAGSRSRQAAIARPRARDSTSASGIACSSVSDSGRHQPSTSAPGGRPDSRASARAACARPAEDQHGARGPDRRGEESDRPVGRDEPQPEAAQPPQASLPRARAGSRRPRRERREPSAAAAAGRRGDAAPRHGAPARPPRRRRGRGPTRGAGRPRWTRGEQQGGAQVADRVEERRADWQAGDHCLSSRPGPARCRSGAAAPPPFSAPASGSRAAAGRRAAARRRC